MKFKLTLLLVLTTFLSFGQIKDFKFGKVSEQEINLKEVSFEKDANAVILSEEGKIDLTPSNYYLTVKRRIKILTEKGINEANIELDYYSKSKNESVSNIKANTINIENGQPVISSITDKDVFDVQINELYSSKRFALPNVKVGSIIEYSYTKNSQHNFSIDAWNFQHELPTLFSEFKLNNQAYNNFSIITIGDDLNTKYKAKSASTTTWFLTNIESFNKLKYVYNAEDQSERIKLQADNYHTEGGKKNTLSAWKSLILDLNNEYETYRNPSAIRDIAQTIPNGKDDVETLKNIVDYVDNNVKWNNFYSIIPRKSNKNLLKEKVGTTADLNLLLNELLIAKGFDSYIILYSTRQHGQIMFGYPFVNQFNSVVTVAKLKNGQSIILDASQLNKEQVEFGPINAFNYHGIVIQKGEPNFVKLNQKMSTYESASSYHFTDTKLVLNRKDNFDGYFYDKDAKDENTLKRYVTESMDIQLDVENEEKVVYDKNMYTKSYRAASNNVKSPFYTVINPLREFLKQYTFEDKNRQRKIEFQFPYLFNIQTKIKIPEGYSVVIDDTFKAHHKIDLGLEYYQEAKIKDNVLTLMIQFILPEGVYEADKYTVLKQFFEKIKTESTKEVLIKKK